MWYGGCSLSSCSLGVAEDRVCTALRGLAPGTRQNSPRTPAQLAPGQEMAAGATAMNARFWTSGEYVLRGPLEGSAWGIMRKQPNQTLRRGA